MPSRRRQIGGAKLKTMCIDRTKYLIGACEDSLVGLPYQIKILPELVLLADDYFSEILPPGSKQEKRYLEYRQNYNHTEEQKRREWLERLLSELKAALHKFQTTPPEMYPALRYGIPENQSTFGSVSKRLGIEEAGTPYSKRMNLFCRRIERCIQNECYDSVALYLRKILESSIVRKYEQEGRKPELVIAGKVMKLKQLITTASKNNKGYLHPSVINKLNDQKLIKLMMDESAHDWAYDPSIEVLDEAMAVMKLALAQLKINNL